MTKYSSKSAHVARAFYMMLRLAYLGDGLSAKFSLFWFLFISRLSHSAKSVSKTFSIRVCGAPLQVSVRNNFADPYVLYEAFVSRDYDRGLPPASPNVIFDVGANVGYITLYLKTKYPDARIFCFEPDPDTFAQLTINTKRYADVVCLPWALGARNGKRTFYRSKTFHMRNSLINNANNEKIDVDGKTFDEALEYTDTKHVDLLKIDIEGGEMELFEAYFPFEKVSHIVGEMHPYLWPAESYECLLILLRRHFTLSLCQDGKKIFFAGQSKEKDVTVNV